MSLKSHGYMKRKIVVMGYMGAGKTTVSAKVAQKLGVKFIDLDDFIEKKEAKSVQNIFKNKGEIYFREKEMQYLKEILNYDFDFILALGGGTPCFGKNMEIIKKSTNLTFYISVPSSVIVKRLEKTEPLRPIISRLKQDKVDMEEFVNKHLFERNRYYSQAQFTIYARDMSVEEVSDRIVEKVNSNMK